MRFSDCVTDYLIAIYHRFLISHRPRGLAEIILANPGVNPQAGGPQPSVSAGVDLYATVRFADGFRRRLMLLYDIAQLGHYSFYRLAT